MTYENGVIVTRNEVNPILTIAIVTFNSESTLKKCFNSVFSQNCSKDSYEVLVVDAGSSDNTLNIVKELQVRVIVEVGCTRGHARNICLDEAKGSLIAMVDSDIVLPQNWISSILKYFDDSSLDAVSCPYRTPMPKLGFLGKIIYYFTSGWAAYNKLGD